MKWNVYVAAMVAAAFLTGCATMQLPNENYEPGETIAAANERGAEKNPEANKHLQAAKKKVAEAKELEEEGEEELARLKLMEAQSEADYALALLRKDAAVAEAKDIRSRVRALEEDMNEMEDSNQ